MKTFFFYLLVLTQAVASIDIHQEDSTLFLTTKRLQFDQFPGAYNPSLIQVEDGFLMTFRYSTEPLSTEDATSYIGIVHLSSDLQPISEPQLLETRNEYSKTMPQSEDARIFSYLNRLFLVYNDSLELNCPNAWERRDMFVSEIYRFGSEYILSQPLKLCYVEGYQYQYWQKNWVPFDWDNRLYFSYSLSPHRVLSTDLRDGSCFLFQETSPQIKWDYGKLRGGTPPIVVDGEYLAFFHSSIPIETNASIGWIMWHYFMGAYTFQKEPPFQITKYTPEPLLTKGFYTPSEYEKRVIFPGGLVIVGSTIYMAYGKDDQEIWIATMDLNELKKRLVPVQ